MCGLGVLGLLPFFATALGCLFLDDLLLALSQRAFLVYSLAILCFLAGTLWGEVLPDPGDDERSTVLISNGMVLFGVFATLTAGPILAALLLALGYMAQFWYELNRLARQRWYARLRGWLTSGAVVSHFLFIAALVMRPEYS